MNSDKYKNVEEKLCAHGVKPTPQRIEIGEVLLATPCHMSADQIIQQLVEKGRPVSKATVYNTLNLFTTHGIVREIAVDPDHMVYDSTTEAHHHFYNTDTGDLIDIHKGSVEISGLPKLPPGTTAESVELIVRIRNKA